MADGGKTLLDSTKTLNREGICSPNGKSWRKTTVYKLLTNEVYTGTLVWGANAKDKAPPVLVENAFPAIVTRIVTRQEYQRVARMMQSRASMKMTPPAAKRCRYTSYICHPLLKQGKETCDTPRLNAKAFEKLIIEQIRENVLTESNIRDLVRLVDEEMDGVAYEQREKVEAIDGELNEIRRRLDRRWQAVETTDLEINDILPRVREHKERQEKLETAANEARATLAARMTGLGDENTIATYVKEMSDFLMESELTKTRAFIRSFVKEVLGPARQGDHPLPHTDAGGQSHRTSGRCGGCPERGSYELGTLWWAVWGSNPRHPD